MEDKKGIIEENKRTFSRGDMVMCNYAPQETTVGEVVGYTPDGEIEVILSITKKRTKTVDKVTTTLKPHQIKELTYVYLDKDDEDGEDEDLEEFD